MVAITASRSARRRSTCAAVDEDGYLSPVDYDMKFEEEMRERETKKAA
jgi:hypothetical protein